MADGWTPVQSPDGVFYCSPRCGSGKLCRREWYDFAREEADKLVARLGPGWTPEVWENLGWHFGAKNGTAVVYANCDARLRVNNGPAPITHFTAFLRSAQQFVCSAEAPEDALGFAVQDARTCIRRIEDDLAALLDGGSNG